MEALSRLLSRAGHRVFIQGFSVDNQLAVPHNISHLLFADDTLIFYGADQNQLWHIKGEFIWLQAVSGLKIINMGKPELVPVGEVANVEDLAGILGCKVSTFSMDYLGLLLGSCYK